MDRKKLFLSVSSFLACVRFEDVPFSLLFLFTLPLFFRLPEVRSTASSWLGLVRSVHSSGSQPRSLRSSESFSSHSPPLPHLHPPSTMATTDMGHSDTTNAILDDLRLHQSLLQVVLLLQPDHKLLLLTSSEYDYPDLLILI